jgi:hypothetical protein
MGLQGKIVKFTHFKLCLLLFCNVQVSTSVEYLLHFQFFLQLKEKLKPAKHMTIPEIKSALTTQTVLAS